MANLDGFAPVSVERFSSLVEQSDATKIPYGCSPNAKNCRFQLTDVDCRYGLQTQYGFQLQSGEPCTGLASLKTSLTNIVNEESGNVIQTADLNAPIAFDAAGNLAVETPVGSRLLLPIAGPQVTPPANASMQVAAAFGKGFLAFTDLKHSLASPAVYNPSLGKLDPLSMRPVGDYWTPQTKYFLGEVVCPARPIGGNGHLYQCIAAGVSGIPQPVFPTLAGATVADGGVTWKEVTPVMALSPVQGNISYGLRYMVTLFVNRNGYISGMTQNSVATVNIAQPPQTTTGYTATIMSLVGGVTAYYFFNTRGAAEDYIYCNAADAAAITAGATPLLLTSAAGSTDGSSLLFDVGGSTASLPMQWAEFDDNGNQTGSQPVFPTGNPSYPGSTPYAKFSLVVQGTLWVPAAGNYTLNLTHKDDVIWGIGGGATLVSATGTWAGHTVTPTLGVDGQTMTVANGYPLLPRSYVSNDDGNGNRGVSNVIVNFPAQGLYPIEIDYGYNEHTGRTLTLTCTAGGSTVANNITPTSLNSIVSNTSSYQLAVSPIPTGPENTIARICAFTPAGQLSQTAGYGISSAGPYFWIPPASQYFTDTFDLSLVPPEVTVADVVNGITMHSTLINDNTTTEATFNFTDDYLRATLNDVSSYFNKIQVPPVSDIYYSKSLQRLIYKPDSLPSGFYISLAGDPESVMGDTGIVQCAENNGENAITARELKGIVYLLKERSGHTLNPDTINPSDWKPVEAWGGEHGSGPCGPRAVDVSTRFMIYVHRSGVYYFDGGTPRWISKEIPDTWATINWAAQQTIWVLIDDETHEVNIGVPTGQSMVPNKVLVCNYEESPEFEPPIHFSPYIGKEIAAGACYKWSVSDIEANIAIRAERPLVNPPLWMPNATAQSQILMGSSVNGNVDAVIPGVFNDNGIGIDFVYETSAGVNPIEPPLVSPMKPCQLGGISADVGGSGAKIWVDVLALRAPTNKKLIPPNTKSVAAGQQIYPVAKPIVAGVPFTAGLSAQNERFRMRFSNHKQPDAHGALKYAALFLRQIATGRPG